VPERIIGPFAFPTRKEAETRIRAILHESNLHEPLVGDEFALIRALLDLHHDAKTKIGAGVVSINVRVIEFGARGFWITRTDGSSIDFSYRTALNGAPTQKTLVQQALRWEIQDQIEEFRAEAFADGPVTCPLTHQPLSQSTAEIDHIVPFADLITEFVPAVGGWLVLQVECVGETGCRRQLVDREIAQTWQDLHKATAQLRVVHKSANLARYRKAPSQP
jgi:hypothetical protein